MHFCTAEIALRGDDRNIMSRTEFAPVSWPEIDVLRFLHGPHSVQNVRPFVHVNQPPRSERDRLAFIYGDEPLAATWGGMNPPTEMNAERSNPSIGTIWFNPLTHRTEKIDEEGRSRGHKIGTFVPPTAMQMLGIPDDEADMVGDIDFLKNPKATIAARRQAESEYYRETEEELNAPERPVPEEEPELDLAEPAKKVAAKRNR